jgi:hypothetical protein
MTRAAWFIAICLILACGQCLIGARAHVKEMSDEDNAWLAEQASDIGICCTGSEALTLVDPDWCVAYEGRCADQKQTEECKLPPRQELMTKRQSSLEIKFCVHLGHTWWGVTDSAVVKAPNRIGPAIVWPIFGSQMLDEYGDPFLNYIRCFLPGAYI